MFEGLLGFVFKALGPGMAVGLVIGGAVAFGWDRRPADWPAYPVRLPFGIHFILGFGDGYPVQLAAQREAIATEQHAFGQLRAAFAVENAAVLNLRTASARWQAASSAAKAKAARDNAWRLDLAARLLRQPPPADTSELGLCRAADAVLLEGGQ